MANAQLKLPQRFSPARLGSLWRGEAMQHWRMFRPQYPPLALEVGDSCLHLVRVDRTKDKKLVVRRYRRIEVPEGAMQVEFGKPNILRPADVGKALFHALEREGIEARGVSLVLPDHLARTALLHLGEHPSRREEVLELIRWKLRKAVPFKIEDAEIDYQMFPAPADGGATLCQAVLILRPVLESYETLMRELGLHVGLVDLSTFNLANLYAPILAEEAGDSFILNVTGSFFALLILRNGVPVFYRAKPYTNADQGDASSKRATVAREVDSSLTYYRERLAGRLPVQIHLRCIDVGLETLQAQLAERIDGTVSPMDVTRLIDVEIHDTDSAVHGDMMQRIAPALGAALGRQG